MYLSQYSELLHETAVVCVMVHVYTVRVFSHHFRKGNNFCDFPFASVDSLFSEMGPTLQRKKSFLQEQIFFLGVAIPF